MILCKCGCGGEIIFKPHHKWKGVPNYIHGHHGKNIPLSEERKNKIRLSRLGQHNSPETEFKKEQFLGVPKTENHRKKISSSLLGRKNIWAKTGKNSPNWKGGDKLSNLRHTTSRRDNFKFIPLNNCEQDGWVGHHLDKEYVIFIPEKLHKSVWHSLIKNKNMDIINDKIYEWFIKYYFGEFQWSQ